MRPGKGIGKFDLDVTGKVPCGAMIPVLQCQHIPVEERVAGSCSFCALYWVSA